MLPIIEHAGDLFPPEVPTAPETNVVAGKSVYVADVRDYQLYRTMLYALGAKAVANRMMAHVNLIVHGGKSPPAKARSKYPQGEFVVADAVFRRFHHEVHSFGALLSALETHGFRLRNPSDEGDPRIDRFELPLVEGSLHRTLLTYLEQSTFVRSFVAPPHFPIDKRDEDFIDLPLPGRDLSWYYVWKADAWRRVSAQRGEGDYPLEIDGGQLLSAAPALWSRSTGLIFNAYPNHDSIDGLFIQAGVSARTGLVEGAAISRVWT